MSDAPSDADLETTAFRPPQARPFSLLQQLFGDHETARVFSAEETVRCWLLVEASLARAEAEAGLLSDRDANAIAEAAVLENVDLEELWREAGAMGLPILPLVRAVTASLPAEHRGRMHVGASSHDVMDTALALQMGQAIDRLEALVGRFGDALAGHVEQHRGTLMAARTQARQAVPTTLGTKFAVFLAELSRQRERLRDARGRACVVSLFGAAGTSAALGPSASSVRRSLARELGLATTDVPWHVARDGVAEFGLACSSLAATGARFGREVIALSRTEIGELGEPAGDHRGGSSTVPQKENPVASEAAVAMAASVTALSSSLFRAMEAGHERAAGEWQLEWEVVPQLACLAAGAIRNAADVAAGLRVFPDAMRRNLEDGRGQVMAEAYMVHLTEELGRELAHDRVYAAAREARVRGVTLEEALGDVPRISPRDHLGEADRICDVALALWRRQDGEDAVPRSGARPEGGEVG